MATVPSPRTWTVAELLTAAKLNTDVRDSINFFLNSPRALMQRSGTQSITTGTWTTVTWDSEQYDNDGGHSDSTNNSRYTAQTAGWFELSALIIPNNGGTYDRGVRFRKNGTGNPFGELVLESMNDNSIVFSQAWVLLSVSDYVEVQVFQNLGSTIGLVGTLDSSPSYWSVRWIGKN
jgi:hypothetical protein